MTVEPLDNLSALALARTSREILNLVQPWLYRRDTRQNHPLAIMWAAGKKCKEHVATAEMAIKTMTSLGSSTGLDSALYKAINCRNIAVAEQIIATGRVDTSYTDDDGATALTVAAYDGYEGGVKRLLAAGFDPEHKSKNNSTPLSEAVFSGHMRVIEMLLATGADPGAELNSVV